MARRRDANSESQNTNENEKNTKPPADSAAADATPPATADATPPATADATPPATADATPSAAADATPPAAAKPKETIRHDAVRCPYCFRFGCPSIGGSQRRSKAKRSKYRQCNGCGRKFTTTQKPDGEYIDHTRTKVVVYGDLSPAEKEQAGS